MDAIALVALWAALAVVCAAKSGGLFAWIAEEWRRARAESWAPTPRRLSGPTVMEKDAQKLLVRQLYTASRMKRSGQHLLAGGKYRPVLNKPVERPETSERRVIPLRRP